MTNRFRGYRDAFLAEALRCGTGGSRCAEAGVDVSVWLGRRGGRRDGHVLRVHGLRGHRRVLILNYGLEASRTRNVFCQTFDYICLFYFHLFFVDFILFLFIQLLQSIYFKVMSAYKAAKENLSVKLPTF